MPKDNLIERLPTLIVEVRAASTGSHLAYPERASAVELCDAAQSMADELTRKQALIEEMVEGLNTIDAAVVMAAERLSCHAQTVAHSLEGGQLKGVMGHNAADLFKASTALRLLITKATDV
jgi:hypothetical protein